MLIDREWIAARIPHQGAMCLLDGVRNWDEQHAHCTASSHRLLDNPLRHRERLGALCAIEYAAQAMAVHSALLVENSGELVAEHGAPLAEYSQSKPISRPSAGYLASARAVDFFVERLDDIDVDLDIEVERLSGDFASVLYRFTIRANAIVLASGRAAVVLDAATIAAKQT